MPRRKLTMAEACFLHGLSQDYGRIRETGFEGFEIDLQDTDAKAGRLLRRKKGP